MSDSTLPPEQWRPLFDKIGVEFGYRPFAAHIGMDHTRLRRLLRGGGTSTDAIRQVADGFRVDPSVVRELRGERGQHVEPFTLPDDAGRLNDTERNVVRAMVRALLDARDNAHAADQPAADPPATPEDTQDQARQEQKTNALRRASSTAPTQGIDLAAADRNPQDLTANAHPHGPDRWPDGQPVYDEHWDQWKAWQGAGAPPGAWEAFRAAERQQAYDLAARFIPGPTDKERMTTAQDQAAEAPHAESGDDPA